MNNKTRSIGSSYAQKHKNVGINNLTMISGKKLIEIVLIYNHNFWKMNKMANQWKWKEIGIGIKKTITRKILRDSFIPTKKNDSIQNFSSIIAACLY